MNEAMIQEVLECIRANPKRVYTALKRLPYTRDEVDCVLDELHRRDLVYLHGDRLAAVYHG